MSHCASDCIACHSSHRLLYDQTHVLHGSLVFMEPHIDSRAKSIQTDRHHPQYSLSWIDIDRQIPIQLGYRLSTRQTWSRASFFSHPAHQTDRSEVGLAFHASLLFRLTQTLRQLTGQFLCFSLVSVLVAFISLIALCCLSYTDMYTSCFIALTHAYTDLRQPVLLASTHYYI